MERCGPWAANFYFVVWEKAQKVFQYKTTEKMCCRIGLSTEWVMVTQSVI